MAVILCFLAIVAKRTWAIAIVRTVLQLWTSSSTVSETFAVATFRAVAAGAARMCSRMTLSTCLIVTCHDWLVAVLHVSLAGESFGLDAVRNLLPMFAYDK